MVDFGLLLKKYIVPALFLILGIALLYVGFSFQQSLIFQVAAFSILITAIISFLNVSGKLSLFKTRIISFGLLISSLILLFFSFNSVSDSMEYQKKYSMCKELSRQNLTDVITAQKAYFKQYKKYAGDWETIIHFIATDSIDEIVREGNLPARSITPEERNFIYRDNRAIDNNMNEFEAYKLSKSKICPADLKDFKIDTIKVSFIESHFTKNRSYIKERLDNKFGEFNPKALRYIPYTNKMEWTIKTKKIIVEKDSISTLRVEGFIPFSEFEGDKSKELFYFGNLEINDLSGSWEEEDK